MWKVYQRGDRFRIGKETRGGLYWYEVIFGTFWESNIRGDAFSQAKYLNTPPKSLLKWEIIDE